MRRTICPIAASRCLDYELRRGRAFAAAKSIHTIQKADGDVIGNVHSVVPTIPKVACYGHRECDRTP